MKPPKPVTVHRIPVGFLVKTDSKQDAKATVRDLLLNYFRAPGAGSWINRDSSLGNDVEMSFPSERAWLKWKTPRTLHPGAFHTYRDVYPSERLLDFLPLVGNQEPQKQDYPGIKKEKIVRANDSPPKKSEARGDYSSLTGAYEEALAHLRQKLLDVCNAKENGILYIICKDEGKTSIRMPNAEAFVLQETIDYINERIEDIRRKARKYPGLIDERRYCQDCKVLIYFTPKNFSSHGNRCQRCAKNARNQASRARKRST